MTIPLPLEQVEGTPYFLERAKCAALKFIFLGLLDLDLTSKGYKNSGRQSQLLFKYGESCPIHPLGLTSNLVQLVLNSWIIFTTFNCLSLYRYYLCYLVLLNTLFVLSLMIARPHQLSIYGSHMIEDAYQSTHIYREVKALTCGPGFNTCAQLTTATLDTYNLLSSFVLKNRNMQVLQQRLWVRAKRSFWNYLRISISKLMLCVTLNLNLMFLYKVGDKKKNLVLHCGFHVQPVQSHRDSHCLPDTWGLKSFLSLLGMAPRYKETTCGGSNMVFASDSIPVVVSGSLHVSL